MCLMVFECCLAELAKRVAQPPPPRGNASEGDEHGEETDAAASPARPRVLLADKASHRRSEPLITALAIAVHVAVTMRHSMPLTRLCAALDDAQSDGRAGYTSSWARVGGKRARARGRPRGGGQPAGGHYLSLHGGGGQDASKAHCLVARALVHRRVFGAATKR